MPSDSASRGDLTSSFPIVPVPEIRDYQVINAELKQQLSQGHPRVRLAGVEGQRLLASGLSGPWEAVVEVDGPAGPEVAAGLNAPNLIVVCRGPVADGAGSRMISGTLVLLGEAGSGLGYAMQGGTILARGDVGPRAGLNQAGGRLVAIGSVGRLAGERQAGGTFAAVESRIGPHAGRGRRGGQFLTLPESDAPSLLGETWERLKPWLEAV